MCKTLQRAFPRVVVIDLLHEYAAADCDMLVHSLPAFGAALVRLTETQAERFRLVYQFDIEGADETQDFNQALRMLYHFGNCMVVIEEIHHYLAREHMPEWLKKLVLVGRHQGVGILATSQRPAEVSKTFVSQCHHVFAGVCFEKNDLAYFRDTIGDVAERLSKIPPFHFLHYQAGAIARIVRNS